MIVLRHTQRLHNINLEGWFTEDIAKLVPKFVNRTLKVAKESEIVIRKNKLEQELSQL